MKPDDVPSRQIFLTGKVKIRRNTGCIARIFKRSSGGKDAAGSTSVFFHSFLMGESDLARGSVTLSVSPEQLFGDFLSVQKVTPRRAFPLIFLKEKSSRCAASGAFRYKP